VADNLRAFDGWFDADQWPSAPCPACKLGDLHPVGNSITTVTTANYDRHQRDEDWEPDWKHGYFYGILYCARPACDEKVIVSGAYRVSMTTTPRWYGDDYEDQLRLRYAIPALPLAIPPAKTPETVMEGIVAASRVVWTDPAGAANGLRRSVEALLNHQKVNKTGKNRHGKRYWLSTHQRIVEFRKRNPLAATSLEAVKWLGNEGSHGALSLTSSDCVESAEYLDHALRLLYDNADAELVKKAKAINKAKGIRRSRR
jgi:Domain of unknown function (DUF4145)